MSTSKPEFVVFYAWQSDRPGNGNRYFIYEAAEEAARQLSADPDCRYKIRIDQDAQGEPGLCDIPATILKKIDTADVFLCDLTYVARSDPATSGKKKSADRLCSNPNVLFETGYAFRSMSPERIVCVMNETFGPAAEQIFDLAHRRFPIVYRWPAKPGSKKTAVGTLAKKLREAIRSVLQLGPRAAIGAADRVSVIRDEFEAQVRAGKFHGLVRPKGAIAIAVIPAAPMRLNAKDLRYEKIPPLARSGWDPKNRGSSVLSVDDLGDHPRSIAEMRADGVILAAETAVLDPSSRRFARKDVGLPVPSDAVEGALIWSAMAYLTELQEVNAPLPWAIGISLLEVKGYWLYAADGQSRADVFGETDIRLQPIVVDAIPEPLDRQAVAAILKPAFDFIWREFGFGGSSNYTEGGIYNVRGS
jgi:hypothetical protein